MLVRTLCFCAVAIVFSYAQDYYDDYYGDQSWSDGYNEYGNQEYDFNYEADNKYPNTYSSGYSNMNRGDRGRFSHRYYNKPRNQYGKSYSQPKPEYVPVVIKKKSTKKKKILSTNHGFYVPGGTAMFGKFKDLHSCQKACEITPTCFAGDFNPWLGKCYLHSNLTACASMRSHKAITHFKKVPCSILESARGFIVLGASTLNGVEIKGIDSLQDCIKKCATAGNGIAATSALVFTNNQVCCNLDYDFSNHKCFFHLCISAVVVRAQFCATTTVNAPVNSIANPSVVSITLCPTANA